MIGGADCASAPAGVYEPATPLDVDAPLMIEPDAIRLPAERHGLGTQASAIRLGVEAAGSARRAAGSKKSQHASGRDSCGHCTRRAGSMAISRPAEVQAGCGAAKGAEWD